MKHMIAVLLLCAALPLAAQTKSAAAPNADAKASAPQLSELYQVKLENLNLRAQMLQQQFEQSPQMQQIRSQYAALVGDIQKTYPGYRWDGHQLVKTSPEPQHQSSAPSHAHK